MDPLEPQCEALFEEAKRLKEEGQPDASKVFEQCANSLPERGTIQYVGLPEVYERQFELCHRYGLKLLKESQEEAAIIAFNKALATLHVWEGVSTAEYWIEILEETQDVPTSIEFKKSILDFPQNPLKLIRYIRGIKGDVGEELTEYAYTRLIETLRNFKSNKFVEYADSHKEFHSLGLDLLHEERQEAASLSFKIALSRLPWDSVKFFEYGKKLNALEVDEVADIAFQKAAESLPKNNFALCERLAKRFKGMGKQDEEGMALEAAAHSLPSRYLKAFNFAKKCLQKGHRQAAEIAFIKSAEALPTSRGKHELCLRHARRLKDENQAEAASIAFVKVAESLSARKGNYDSCLKYALILKEEDQDEAAKIAFIKGAEALPTSRGKHELCLIYAEQLKDENQQEAVGIAFEKMALALPEKIGNHDMCLDYARRLRDEGQIKPAKIAFNKAANCLSSKFGNHESCLKYARILVKEGQEEAAKIAYEKSVKCVSKSFDLCLELEDILKSEKRIVEAALALDQAMKIVPSDIKQQIDFAMRLKRDNIKKANRIFREVVSHASRSFEDSMSCGILLQRKRVTEWALVAYRNAYEKKASYKPLFRMGQIYYRRRKYEKAIENLIDSIAKDPTQYKSVYLLGRCHQKQAAEELEDWKMREGLEKAKEQFLEAIQINGQYGEAFTELGLVLIELEEFKQSYSISTKATEFNPSSPKSWFALGESSLKLGLYVEALKYYKQAQTKNPDSKMLYARLHLGMSWALLKLNNLQQAEYHRKKAKEFRFIKEEDFLLQGHIEEAHGHSNRALKLYGRRECVDRIEAQLGIGRIQLSEGRYDEAYHIFKDCMRRDRKLTQAEWKKAVTNLVQDIETGIEYSEYLVGIDEMKKAEEVFEKLTEKYGTRAKVWYYYGWLYEKWGNIPKAREKYQRALEYDSSYSKASEALDRIKEPEEDPPPPPVVIESPVPDDDEIEPDTPDDMIIIDDKEPPPIVVEPPKPPTGRKTPRATGERKKTKKGLILLDVELVGERELVNREYVTYKRDYRIATELKERYEFRCQVCQKRIQVGQNTYTIDAHHIHPLGALGPDKMSNLIILCPTHHREFDLGVACVEQRGKIYRLRHKYDKELDGKIIKMAKYHRFNPKCLQHAMEKIYIGVSA